MLKATNLIKLTNHHIRHVEQRITSFIAVLIITTVQWLVVLIMGNNECMTNIKYCCKPLSVVQQMSPRPLHFLRHYLPRPNRSYLLHLHLIRLKLQSTTVTISNTNQNLRLHPIVLHLSHVCVVSAPISSLLGM